MKAFADKILLLPLALLLLPLVAGGATIRMPNGETLVGEVLERDGNTLVFRSESFGVLRLDAASVSLVDEPVAAEPALPMASAPGAATTPGMAADVTPAIAKPRSLFRRLVPLPENFSGNLSLGADLLRSEVDVNNYMAELNLGWTTEANEFQTYHYYEYALVGVDVAPGVRVEQRNTDEFEHAVRWIRHLGDRWILLSQANWSRDEIKQIDYAVDVLVVPGYYLIKTDNTRLLLGVGPSYGWEAFDIPDGEEMSRFRIALYQLFRHKFTPRLTLEQTFLGYYGLEDLEVAAGESSSDYSFSAQVKLSQMLTDFLSINIKYTYDLDSTPAPTVDKVKTRLITMLGYEF